MLMQVSGLEKRYTKANVLEGVDFALPAGKIIGLLGPNGSGKTTLMKIIAGLITPDSGEVVYPLGAARGVHSKRTISFLPDESTFPAWMKVEDAFAFFKEGYPDFDEGKAEQMRQLLGIEPGIKLKSMSKGERERVALGLAFSRRAAVYLLDEPLGGIDPVGKHQIIKSIISAHDSQSSILLSTHLVRDVEGLFDEVLFIRQGKIVFAGDCEDIREVQHKTVEQVYMEVFGSAA